MPNLQGRYEALRRWAEEGSGDRAATIGLAVLRYRGMAAWLEVVPLEGPEATEPEEAARGSPAAVEVGPLVACMAQMLIGARRDSA